MKINGKILDGPSHEILVLEHNGEEIVFKAQAVLSYEEFEKIYPHPQPPSILKRGAGKAEKDFNDKKYQKELDEYASAKSYWMILKSLEPSKIEWQKVKMDDPSTYKYFDDELSAVFTEATKMEIMNIITTANGLNDDKLKEARERFLALKQGKVAN